MSLIVTDLNTRERDRFARGLERIAKDATRLAAALRTEDDTEAIICLLGIAISATLLDELHQVFKQGLVAVRTKAPDDASTLSDTTPVKEDPA